MLAGRLLSAALTALLSTLAVFLLVHAVPGSIVEQMLGQAGDPETEEALRGFFGLDQPLWRQYLSWLGAAVQGDLGLSWNRGVPVRGLVLDAFLVSLELGMLTLLVATLVGVPLGVVAGMRPGGWLDSVIGAITVLGLSAPVFWVGLLLLLGTSWALGWSPPLAWQGPTEDLQANLAMLALPVASLGGLQAAAYAAFVRQVVVAARREMYVRTAHAKGLPDRVVFFRHVLRNVLIPTTTFMGLVLVQVLGGVVVTESLFALPGLGRLLVSSLANRDYPIVQGGLLLVVLVAMAANLGVDLLYQAIDPRLRRR